MQLHTVTPSQGKRVQRLGRGGKRGTTSGRGTKGQRSRAGRKIRPAMRDLIIRLPKHRGFRNKPLSTRPVAVDLAKLVKRIASLGKGPITIDRTFLRTEHFVTVGYKGEIKVLGKAEVTQVLNLKGLKTSKTVASQIEKAGGKIE